MVDIPVLYFHYDRNKSLVASPRTLRKLHKYQLSGSINGPSFNVIVLDRCSEDKHQDDNSVGASKDSKDNTGLMKHADGQSKEMVDHTIDKGAEQKKGLPPQSDETDEHGKDNTDLMKQAEGPSDRNIDTGAEQTTYLPLQSDESDDEHGKD